MKYAPVVPPLAYKMLPPWREASFCYTSEAIRDDDYRTFFVDAKNVVIDNPVYEAFNGTKDGRDNKPAPGSASPQELKALIYEIKPLFAFMPDVVDNAYGTLNLAQPYLSLIGDASLAAVLQGTTIEEVVDCAKQFKLYGISRYGISIFTPRHAGISRLRITRAVLEQVPDALFHWLGADYPYEEEQRCDIPAVLTCDTAEAFNAAHNMANIMSRAEARRRPEGFMELEGSEAVEAWFLQNVEVIQRWFEPQWKRTTVT